MKLKKDELSNSSLIKYQWVMGPMTFSGPGFHVVHPFGCVQFDLGFISETIEGFPPPSRGCMLMPGAPQLGGASRCAHSGGPSGGPAPAQPPCPGAPAADLGSPAGAGSQAQTLRDEPPHWVMAVSLFC